MISYIVRTWVFIFLSLFCFNVFAADAVIRRVTIDSTQSATCDGLLAQRIWRAWDNSGYAFVRNALQSRLVAKGDVYVLYDTETLLHNLLSMADRCADVAPLRQLAQIIQIAYSQLEPDSINAARRLWVCRGGEICNAANRLKNKEVMLASVQFLAFATQAANALHNRSQNNAEDRQFVRDAVQISLGHLLRWGDAAAVKALKLSSAATLSDVRDGSSRYLLTDKVLWQLAVYAHLAGIFQRDPALLSTLELDASEWKQLRVYAAALAELVRQRTFVKSVPGDHVVQLADLDTGFWRYYKDNRYAAYQEDGKPVICSADDSGNVKSRAVVPLADVPFRDDIGWDLSHARRLVHYFAAMNENRAAAISVWKLPGTAVPSQAVMRGFAQNLLSSVWNQDERHPLFSNYLSGANGWYRVNYNNGTGRCVEGSAPHGLTGAFLDGGFVTWGFWVPQLRVLGWRLLTLSEADDADDRAFMSRYYPGFNDAAPARVSLPHQLMFWPTLVGNDNRDDK